jgi:hypothetical protein
MFAVPSPRVSGHQQHLLERGAVSWRGASSELRDDLALRRKVLWL